MLLSTIYITSIFSFLYYFLIYLVLVMEVNDKCGCFTLGKKKGFSFWHFAGMVCGILHSFCTECHQFLNSQPSKHQWYPVSLFHSRFLSLRPSTRKHYNYFLFLVGIGHGTSVNNNHSLWTSLYLYISDSITIGTIEVYFIFIPVLLVLFSPRGKIKWGTEHGKLTQLWGH